MAKKSGNMNVAVTINDTYFYPLYVMLHTLYSVHPDVCITVFLIHSRVSRENIQKLQEVCQKYGGRLQEIFVESSMFSDAPAYLYFTKEMYYRILCAGLLPESVDRVLYLDPDLIVMDCLKEVYDMSMDDCLFAGCADRNVDKYKKEYKRALGMNPDSTYFNSGVLLCNLKKLRCEQQADDVFAMLRERGSRLLFPDQDIINVLYEGKIARLDDRYNLNPNLLYAYEFLKYNFIPWAKKPAIFHYMGKKKPWNPDYCLGMYQYYWTREMKYTYLPRGPIRKRILKNPCYIFREGCYFLNFILRRLFPEKYGKPDYEGLTNEEIIHKMKQEVE